MRRLPTTVVLLASLCVALPVSAEPVLVNLEASAAVPLTEPQSDRFGPGGMLAGGFMYPLFPPLLLGGRLRLGLLLDGEPPADNLYDPGTGGLATLCGTLRLRPFSFSEGEGESRGTGLFLEAGGGGAVTGKLVRAAFDAGIGWGFRAGLLDVAPAVRFLQVMQPEQVLESRDARLLLFGVELVFLDSRPPPAPEVKRPPPDRDGDGVVDSSDSCPDEREDPDGFEDEDGCPDADNDQDGIADGEDGCPDDPEDVDGFQDEDGCPDPDNDGDTFPDLTDSCPDQPETVNGNQDFDGCPDEGLVQMIDDRIVLEERVLFDLERSRVKSAAMPVLRAIAKMQKHHPEWISLRVEGHTDVRGSPEYNQCLSARRAANVRRILVKMGIPADMIDAVGYGSMNLRDPRNTPGAHRRNRRVEFVVMARVPAASEGDAEDKEAAEGSAGAKGKDGAKRSGKKEQKEAAEGSAGAKGKDGAKRSGKKEQKEATDEKE
jgi:outer membrane protein OmpA-like peptidoglycan-associated protein